MGIVSKRAILWRLECDVDGCEETSPAARFRGDAKSSARSDGWMIDDDGCTFCPDHAAVARAARDAAVETKVRE